MATSREARPSEKMVNAAFSWLRSLDKVVWHAESLPGDVEELIALVKRELDAAAKEYRRECKERSA